MKAQKGPMLPMISARGNTSARGQESQRSRSDNNKFNKLKGVLVNNLLKYYHKQTQRQGDNAVYAKAVEEVERILQHGKLREKDLRDLQHNFAAGMGIPGDAMVPQPPSGPRKGSGADGRGTGRVPDSAAGRPVDYDMLAQQQEGMSTASGSPSKRQVKP